MPIINSVPGGSTPTGSAGGDLGGTYPNPTVTGGTHLTAASVAIASLADPTTGKVIGSTANAAAAVFPPGFEFGYDQITSAVNVTGTTAGTANAIITCAAHTFDGAAVLLTFFSPQVALTTTAGGSMGISLWESGAPIGDFAFIRTDSATGQDLKVVSCFYRFTPSAASHTYTIAAYTSSTTGTPSVGAGAGGSGVLLPAFCRFTKV